MSTDPHSVPDGFEEELIFQIEPETPDIYGSLSVVEKDDGVQTVLPVQLGYDQVGFRDFRPLPVPVEVDDPDPKGLYAPEYAGSFQSSEASLETGSSVNPVETVSVEKDSTKPKVAVKNGTPAS